MEGPNNDLMRPFVIAWIEAKLKERYPTWSQNETARQLGLDQGVWSRLVHGEVSYSRKHNPVPEAARLLGEHPVDIYAGALRLWKRDPAGLTLDQDD